MSGGVVFGGTPDGGCPRLDGEWNYTLESLFVLPLCGDVFCPLAHSQAGMGLKNFRVFLKFAILAL